MPECQKCESFVSNQFARVYGNENNEIFRCINCVSGEEGGRSILREGGGAVEDLSQIRTKSDHRNL